MGFNGWKFAKSLYVVLLLSGLACLGQDHGGATVTVLLQNHVHVNQSAIRHAEAEAARIFRAAGIELNWVDCSATHQCHRPPGRNEFVLSLLQDGKTASDMAFGVAFMGADGIGKYSDVFVARIERQCGLSGQDFARLLGTVAAHELGHLVLGSHAHSDVGVMNPTWRESALRQLEVGNLLFTRDQASLMRQRLQRVGDVQPWATASVKVRWEPSIFGPQ
jgi:hypothetical protein